MTVFAFFSLLVLFQLKHYLIDFHWQTQAQIKTKGIWFDPVGMGHSLEHALGTMIILLPFMFLYAPAALFVIAMMEFIIHYTTDYVKMRHGNKDITQSKFWHELGLDQMVHQLNYVLNAFMVLAIMSAVSIP